MTGADLGGAGALIELPKLKWHYNMLTWLQNAINPNSKDLNFQLLWWRMPLDPLTGDGHSSAPAFMISEKD